MQDIDEAALQAEQEEREALGRIVLAFKDYRRAAEAEVARWEHNYQKLPNHHKFLLPSLPQKFAKARQNIYVNQFFIASLLAAFEGDGDGSLIPPHLANPSDAAEQAASSRQHASPGDVEKVRYVLKNVARDWSAECAGEREQCYGPILEELRELFKDRAADAPRPRVLVPGAGLGRLCCEVAGLGYEAQGNEFSYFMLLTSSFLLNCTAEAEQYTLYPWLHSNCNSLSDADQLRGVAVPDKHPTDIVAGPGLLSMCAGDFLEVYGTPAMAAAFDCVVTCFFIDTAHNVVQYLEVISHCLKKGGAWVNLGPLLYHWADGRPDELSIEVSLEDIRRVAQQLGFKLVKESSIPAPYIANTRSMYQTIYNACFWTMIKERENPMSAEARSTWHRQFGELPGHMAPPPPPPPHPPPREPASQHQHQHQAPEQLAEQRGSGA
eukprot:CAMPEP_0202895146 /NCGR_PEP_ID=MMETSP1392-20130828/4405_1 /ASSEMBLY_ACC=CAM_ASM_000868 /TAXON_ID=225041 /ORGANISM="Chlamydomonas chlamydogama, Strain SAG 11-48b" /LENGTH=436 /DNA_ID=CAMNT_0049580059 /DNA_START=74 /DNA_END=1384 /DNA_ORIENTATION=-